MNLYYGIKHQMNQIWDQTGKRHPITVLKTDVAQVTQVKTEDNDGYSAIQVGFGQKSVKNIPQAQKGHLKLKKSAKVAPRYFKEIRLEAAPEQKVGDTVSIDQVFEVGDIVQASGTSKGRGFAGVMKRWGFGGGPRTHGQSDRERAPGSIGQGTDPGRVHKGKKMPGHFGNVKHTIKNLQIVYIAPDGSEVWIKGNVPGAPGTVITLKKTGHKDFPGLHENSQPEAEAVAEPKEEATETPQEKELKEAVATEEKAEKEEEQAEEEKEEKEASKETESKKEDKKETKKEE